MNKRQYAICGFPRQGMTGAFNREIVCFGLARVLNCSLTVLVCVLWTLCGLAQSRWQIQNPNLNGITFGQGKFMAVGQAGAIWTSTDAVSWKQQWSGTRSWLSAVTFGSNKFIVVGGPNGPTEGPAILSSLDGASWQTRSSNNISRYSGVSFGNNLFVALGGGSLLTTSSDGLSWFSRLMDGEVAAVAFGQNTFVAAGAGGLILTSPDAVTWTARVA